MNQWKDEAKQQINNIRQNTIVCLTKPDLVREFGSAQPLQKLENLLRMQERVAQDEPDLNEFAMQGALVVVKNVCDGNEDADQFFLDEAVALSPLFVDRKADGGLALTELG